MRTSLAQAGVVSAREDWLDHDYKELTIPAQQGRHALERNALHVWPRGGFMLIALPNTDGSFTATLLLSRSRFAERRDADAVRGFFAREFPDAVPHVPDLVAQFFANPQGQLGTVYTAPGHVGGQVVLMGDADFYAGIWAHFAERTARVLDPGDIEEALRAAAAVGDDRLQRQSRGVVVPDGFTHGTSEQRMRWFRLGYETGDPSRGNTFGADAL